MKIALCTKALITAHKDRGVGQYTALLLNSLKEYKQNHTFIEFTDVRELPTDVDCVHFTYLDLFSRSLQFPPFRTKTLITIHDLIPLRFPEHFPVGLRGTINWWLQKNTLKKVDAIITDSESSKKDIYDLIKIPPERVCVVYLAPSADFKKLPNGEIAKLRMREKYNLQGKFTLYVGDVNWNKNIPGLIKAFKKIKDTNQKPKTGEIKLVLVGKAFLNGQLNETKEINQLIRQLKLDKEIIKLGFVPTADLAGIYNLASVYVQPSFYEGFGLPVLEAMNCGVPVIAANRGSLPEIVGTDGILVDPNYEDIADAIIEILHYSDDQRIALIKKGFEQAKKFSWKIFAQQMISLYEKTVKENN